MTNEQAKQFVRDVAEGKPVEVSTINLEDMFPVLEAYESAYDVGTENERARLRHFSVELSVAIETAQSGLRHGRN